MNPEAKSNGERRKKRRRETLGGSVERVAPQDNLHARKSFHLHELYRDLEAKVHWSEDFARYAISEAAFGSYVDARHALKIVLRHGNLKRERAMRVQEELRKRIQSMVEISETNEYDAEGQDREDYTGKANVLLQLGNFSSAKTVAARAARMFISKVEIIDWSEHSMVEEASRILEVLIKTNLFEEADVIASSAIAHEEMWSTTVDFRTVLGIDIALALSVNAKGDEDLAVQFFPSADMNQLLQQVADNGDATKYIQHQFARFLPFPRMLARHGHSKLQAPLSVNTCLDGHENNLGVGRQGLI